MADEHGSSASDEARHEHSDEHSDGGGARHGASDEPRQSPFGRGTTKADDELAGIRIPAGLIREFDGWYQGQFAGARQRPSKDGYYGIAFRLGLERLKEAIPPVQSLDDRLAELGLVAS